MASWPRKPPSGTVEIKPPEDVYLTLERWPKEAFDVHFHDAFNWLVPMRPGEMTVWVAGQDLRVDGNQWICIFPNTPHAVRSVSDGIEVMSLFLSHDEMAEGAGSHELSPEMPYILGGKGTVAQGLALQWAESRLAESEGFALRPALTRFLAPWLWSFHGKSGASGESPEIQLKLKLDVVGQKTWKFIEAHRAESPFPWEVLAEELGVSLRTYQRTLAQKMSLTPSELLALCRVDYCRRALRDPDVDLADMAIQAGFSSQSHFSTVFKVHTGLSPRQYRLQLERLG